MTAEGALATHHQMDGECVLPPHLAQDLQTCSMHTWALQGPRLRVPLAGGLTEGRECRVRVTRRE